MMGPHDDRSLGAGRHGRLGTRRNGRPDTGYRRGDLLTKESKDTRGLDLHRGGAMTKTFRVRVVRWAFAAFVCIGGLIALGWFLPELTRSPGESQRERYQRENQRVRDSIQKAGETCSRDFPGRLDLYAECLARLTRMIPPARY